MIKDFFLLCSGVDQNLIKDCSNGEQNKYAGIGATVFFTALMATIASSYALYTVFDNIFTSIFFGILWGLLIFNLDRFIVSTIKKRHSKRQEIIQVIPRLILAMIIAVVISKPLELKIFEKEINQVLLKEKNQMTLDNKTQIAQQFTPEIEKINTEINSLKEEITNKENEVNTLYETYIAEAEGRKGTKLLGKGPVYKEKREKHDAALAELSQLKKDNVEKIKSKEDAITSLIQQQKEYETKTQPIISNFDGLMARVNALNKLPWLPSFFIFLLFLAIETAPIFAKLISSKSEYDYKLENQESLVKTWIQQQVHQREAILKTDVELNNRIYSDLKTEEELYNYKQKIARNLMKLQADSFYKNQQDIL
ncbi:DUF4407 domain-containing protein [Tenacibaculum sp. IB213877]|uniref:DUF4407 domain-containing protein n=1 Tax=Tenacibaculum sp. IB213877 TaxID=3097351 RepID=UPI002A5AD474|nr:DUF4407 domain-containing protein [Tenacibaculum sp. IB213877]MDY0780766.1 DUF4407 domain-containing protein [Tenacibaculum sp. IB213877]